MKVVTAVHAYSLVIEECGCVAILIKKGASLSDINA